MIPDTVRRAQKGDKAAFAELYSQHYRQVFGVCMKLVKQKETAEDLAQDTFLRLYLKLQTFRGESAFGTWLHRMAFNTALMSLRLKRYPVVELDWDTPTSRSVRDTMASRDLQLEGIIDRMALTEAIEDLPPGQRKIFRLKQVDGCPHSEIASRLGCTVGNSKRQVYAAKMHLRRKLKPKRLFAL